MRVPVEAAICSPVTLKQRNINVVSTLRNIYQIKINLVGAKPPIWRRILVDSSTTLPVFHEVLQIVMGWTNSHLHQFIAGSNYYGIPDPDFSPPEFRDEKKFRLSQLLKSEKDTLIYEYDFGDGWEHKIVLEKIMPFTPNANVPTCIKGKGACPPEDVGGIWGFYNFLEALGDKKHPEHKHYLEWCGGDFNSDHFDLNEVNEVLTEYFEQ